MPRTQVSAHQELASEQAKRTALVRRHVRGLDSLVQDLPVLLLLPEECVQPVVRVHLDAEVRAQWTARRRTRACRGGVIGRHSRNMGRQAARV